MDLQPVNNAGDGGGAFDCLWPEEVSSLGNVCALVAESLVTKGYCLIQMRQSDADRQTVLDSKKSLKFERLESSIAEAFLGPGGETNHVACIEQSLDPSHPLMSYVYKMTTLGEYMGLVAESVFGFAPASGVQSHSSTGLMLREASSSRTASGAVSVYRTESDTVQYLLNFIRRRKLCMMQFITCGDGRVVELSPSDEEVPYETVSLPVVENTLLIFRHDLLKYAYTPAEEDLVLQGWVWQEPLTWPGGAITGSEEDIKAVIGAVGPPMPKKNDVQVKSLTCKIGAHGNGADATNVLYTAQCDVFVKIPLSRWDHDVYWTPNRDDGRGLSGVRHCGMLSDEDIFTFDNEKFNLSEDMAKTLRPTAFFALESAYEVLYHAGYSMETMRGKPIQISVAGFARESEMVDRMHQNMCGPYTMYFGENMIVSYHLGLTGKSLIVDTACSASNVAFNDQYHDIRRQRDARKFNMLNDRDESKEGVTVGSIWYNDPGPFVGLSQAHMLGNIGRSRTYDMSADGYARGEGVGAGYLKLDDDFTDNFGYVIGGFVNQDGRSASLTAPNGPSQTAVIRGGLRDAGREHLEVNLSEMHGTGTAIGDPIETGSLRACMLPGRVVPLLHQAGKSMTGHLESGAGITGIIKTLLAMRSAVAYANCHLMELNSNVDCLNYPAVWPTEVVEMSEELNHYGISSFGFGGTNARVDLYGSCRRGQRAIPPVAITEAGCTVYIDGNRIGHKTNLDAIDVFLTPCAGCRRNMCWICGEIAESIASGRHQCSVVRRESTSYEFCSDCYNGEYMVGQKAQLDAGDSGLPVYILGSWTDYSVYEEMRPTDYGYACVANLKDVRFARFRVVLDKDPAKTIYPSRHQAGHGNHHVLGPDKNSNGREWQIDVDSIGGSLRCKIEFAYDYGKKSVSWQAAETREIVMADAVQIDAIQTVSVREHNPIYSIVGSFNGWQIHDMVPSDKEDGLYEATFTLGHSGSAEFQFMVDHDPLQIIYPDGVKVVQMNVPILGPAKVGSDRTWFVLGLIGEQVKVQLRNFGSGVGMSLTLRSATAGLRRWYSGDRWKTVEPKYYVAGAFNEWAIGEPMTETVIHGVYRTQVFQLPVGVEYFKILIDKDWQRLVSGCIIQRGMALEMWCDMDSGGLQYAVKAGVPCTFRFELDMRNRPPELNVVIDKVGEVSPAQLA